MIGTILGAMYGLPIGTCEGRVIGSSKNDSCMGLWMVSIYVFVVV